MLRRIGAIVLGFLIGFFFFVIIQMLIGRNFPPPSDFNPVDKEALNLYFKSLPNSFFVFITMAHGLSALLGSLVSAKFADKFKLYLGLLVGVMFLVATFSYMAAIPIPNWMIIADPLLVAVLAFVGAKLGSRE